MREITVRMLQTCVSPDPGGWPVGLAELHQVITLSAARGCGHVDGMRCFSMPCVVGGCVRVCFVIWISTFHHIDKVKAWCLSCEGLKIFHQVSLSSSLLFYWCLLSLQQPYPLLWRPAQYVRSRQYRNKMFNLVCWPFCWCEETGIKHFFLCLSWCVTVGQVLLKIFVFLC